MAADGMHVVKVSPRHSVTVEDDYFSLIERAPTQDFVVRTLAKRMAGDTPLMSGELVIAGRGTREGWPLAAAYPLHFRKTYHVGRLRGDPKAEFEHHTRASEILGIPPPIGHTVSTFRSCLLPGRPFDLVIPFGSEPEESNIKHADKLSLGEAAGLWLLAERIFSTLAMHTCTTSSSATHRWTCCPSTSIWACCAVRWTTKGGKTAALATSSRCSRSRFFCSVRWASNLASWPRSHSPAWTSCSRKARSFAAPSTTALA
jgi:hypothetical protein